MYMHVRKNKRISVGICKCPCVPRYMHVCPWTLVYVPKITILSQYIGNILPISGLYLDNMRMKFYASIGVFTFCLYCNNNSKKSFAISFATFTM